MKPGALILCLGLICVVEASCQPIPTQPPKAFGAVGSIACQIDAVTFVKTKVFFLSLPFDPQATNQYHSPSGPIVGDNSPPYSRDLIAAYNAAPPFFQGMLCGLDGVFIVKNQCNTNPCVPGDVIDYSWGSREHPSQFPSGPPAKYGRYIAISQQLWRAGQPPSLTAYETGRLQHLLGDWTKRKNNVSPPSLSYAKPNSGMSVLAALAHEFGHVLWWDGFVKIPGGDIKPSDPAACNAEGQQYLKVDG